MTPKKNMAFLTISSSNTTPVTTLRHTWPKHWVVKDCFWDKALNEPVEVNSTFKYRSSGSSNSGMPLDRQVYLTLPVTTTTDNVHWFLEICFKEESWEGKRPILRYKGLNRIPKGTKTSKNGGRVLALPCVKQLLNRMEILKAIIQTRSIAIEENLAELDFLMFRWSTETHLFVAACRSSAHRWRCGYADVVSSIWRGPHYRGYSEWRRPEEGWISELVSLEF